MDLRQLELFLAVMDTTSVTLAAHKMYITPGAVSLQLHNLAAELRTELFIPPENASSPLPTPTAWQNTRAASLKRSAKSSRNLKTTPTATPAPSASLPAPRR
jgi:hypothetical protein